MSNYSLLPAALPTLFPDSNYFAHNEESASEDYLSSTTHTLSLQVSYNSLKDGVPSGERQKNTTAPSSLKWSTLTFGSPAQSR